MNLRVLAPLWQSHSLLDLNMVRLLAAFSSIIIVIAFACSKPQYRSYNDILEFGVFVRNEDTVSKTVLILRKNQQFVYYNTRKYNSKPETIAYDGRYRDAGDTIWLTYYKNKKPDGVVDYLIREVSGTYFIQPFVDNRPRMFLRKVNADGRVPF